MKREDVSSSTIVSIGYNEESNILEIEFKSGGIYQYFGISKAIYIQLMSADSIGTFHSQHIKNTYQFVKV